MLISFLPGMAFLSRASRSLNWVALDRRRCARTSPPSRRLAVRVPVVDLARSVFDDRVCPPGARARMRIYFLARAVRQVAWSLGHETLDWAAMLLAGGRGLNTVFALVFQENHLSLDVRIVLIVFVKFVEFVAVLVATNSTN